MRVTTLCRYPVKSMLGERIEQAAVGTSGVHADRTLALIDAATGLVATAKHPRLWRDLLKYSATVSGERVLISSPAGWTLDADDPGLDQRLSEALGRSVRLFSERPSASSVERPDPEDVLSEGVEAEVPAALLEIGQGSPGSTFVDYAPVHLMTTATLEHLGTEYARYRPNIVVETPEGTAPYVENDWVGREIRAGGAVLQVVLPTPRCAVPTLEHGELPRAPHAVRTLLDGNRIEVPGFGVLPCAGGYAQVTHDGVVRVGDDVTVH